MIAKIRKLLALASRNPFRHEAESASAKVRDLLKKHGLTISDIEEQGEPPVENIFGDGLTWHEETEIEAAFARWDEEMERVWREFDAELPRLMREMDAELLRLKWDVSLPVTTKEETKAKPVTKKRRKQARGKRAR